MSEEQYIINRRARRDKYKEYKAIENNERLKQRVEDMKTRNTISSILKSQKTNKNIDDNINTLIDKIKDENPEFTQEQVKQQLQQKYDVRNAKVPEFKSISEADEIYNKMQTLGKSSVYNKMRATQDPELKARLYELYRLKGKPAVAPIIPAPALPPALPATGGPAPGGPALPPILPAPKTRGRPPGAIIAPAPAPAQKKTPLKTSFTQALKNIIAKTKQQAPSSPPVARMITPPSPPVARMITPPTLPPTPPPTPPPTKKKYDITKKTTAQPPQPVALSKAELKAIEDVKKRIAADDLLNASSNAQPFFGKQKKTKGKGLKHINPKYFTSYNTMY